MHLKMIDWFKLFSTEKSCLNNVANKIKCTIDTDRKLSNSTKLQPSDRSDGIHECPIVSAILGSSNQY